MNKMVRRLLVSALWLSIACSLPVAAAASEGPVITIPEKSFHFGEFSEMTPVSHDFLVKNDGGATLNIKDVQPS